MSGRRLEKLEADVDGIREGLGELKDVVYNLAEALSPEDKGSEPVAYSAANPTNLNAKDAIVSIPKTVDAMELMENTSGVVEGVDDSIALVKPVSGDVDDPVIQEKIQMEAFMQEKIKIRVHGTNEKNAAPYFMVSVNGEKHILFRKQEHTLPRYVVETLARAKPTTYENEEFTGDDGIRKVRWPSTTGLRYPFEVIQDDNPLGRNWLNAVLNQP